jgi:iron complex outermembrane receptor protein
MRMQTRLLIGSALGVCAMAPALSAPQSTSGDSSGSPKQVTPDAAPIQDIVVTAERRSQSLQRAPAAVTAVSGATLVSRGISDLKGLSLLVPSTRFSVETNVVQVYIRGVGSQIDSPFVPEPVATNFNDVYMPRFVTGTALYDISRIEVLPGPQGTLYGKSALGGVVNINANLPTHDWGADVTFEGGNYGSTHLTAVVNAPLTPELAIRVAGNMSNHDAYFTNGTDTEHSKAARASLLYTPSNLSIYAWASYYENHDTPQASVYIPYLNPKNPWNQPRSDPSTAPFYPPDGYDVSNLFGHYRAALFGGKIDWKLDGATITYIPAFVDYHHNDVHGLQGFPVPDTSTIHQNTQELRIAGDPDARLSWLGGLYYYHNSTFWHAVLGPFLGGYRVPNVAQGEAAFAQLGYRLLPSLRLTAGGRYSWDREDTSDAATVFPASLAPPTEGLIPFEAHPRWHHFDWKIGAEADVAPHSIIYANVQSGYAPGGYQSVQPVAGEKIQQQTMTGYTVGTKNRFFDGTLQINDEAFFYNYKNYDITVQQGAASVSVSVPKTRIYGNQLDLIYALGRNTSLDLGVGLLDAEIRKLAANGVNYKGYQLPYAPSTTISVGLQHSFDLASGASFLFRVDSHYESHYWGVFSHTSGLRQSAFTKTDITATYTEPQGRWDLSLWGRNLEKRATIAAAAETGYPEPFSGTAYLESPRTYGVRLHVKFGHP